MAHRIVTLAQTLWLRWLLVLALVLLYAGWTGYVISRDKLVRLLTQNCKTTCAS